MQLLRLRGRKTNDRLLRQGTVWKGRTMIIRWLPGAPLNDSHRTGVFLGSFASAKLDKSAVRRNRMRRRCREALRTTIASAENLPTVQLLVAPRSPSLTCDYAAIRADAEEFVSSLVS